MDRFEKFMILFIIVLFLSLSIAVVKTAYGIQGNLYQRTELNRERRHLPALCDQYYDNGTHQWKECMGVELKAIQND